MGLSRHVATGHDDCDAFSTGKPPLLAGRTPPRSERMWNPMSRFRLASVRHLSLNCFWRQCNFGSRG